VDPLRADLLLPGLSRYTGPGACVRPAALLPAARYRDPFHTNAVSTESFVTYDTYDLLVEETRDALDNRSLSGNETSSRRSRSFATRRTIESCSLRW